jgi:hypothetical protein
MKSFQDHLDSFGKNNAELLFNSKILRSSAIFPFIISKQLDVKILFLSYWLLKRKISDISCKITIRNMRGRKVYSKDQKINYIKSFSVSVKKILRRCDIKIDSGSIEIEFFSNLNLVFPYPAVLVNFDSKNCSTFVHSCGRTFNNNQDLQRNTKFLVPESGFDLLPNKEFNSFFSFVNGDKKLLNQKIELILLNQFDEKIKKVFKLKVLKPYETKFFFFLQGKEKSFLKNKKGSVIINHSMKNFFPRFMCGNLRRDASLSTLTHSYYDLSKNRDKKLNLWKNPDPKKYYDGVVAIPVFFDNKKYTELVIYPNFFKKNFNLKFQFINQGKVKNLKKEIFINKDFKFPLYLNMTDIVLSEVKNINLDKTYVIKIICDGKTIIPTRIKFGLNIGQNKGENVPSNVCFNVFVPTKNFERKPKTFKWGLVLPNQDHEIFLSNVSFLKKKFKKANVELKFWSSEKNKCLIKKITINDNGSYRFNLKENIRILKFFKNKPGWFTAVSDNPFVTGFFINFGKNGIVGADHFF